MDTRDKISIIQSNIEAFRREINLRIESQNNLWRLVIAGLAAVVVLKSDINVGRFLPVLPIVAMLILAYWFGETLYVFRTGRWIASMEAQINTLVGNEILQHESIMWRQRKATLWGRMNGLMDLLVVAATLSYLFAAANLYRIYSLLRQP